MVVYVCFEYYTGWGGEDRHLSRVFQYEEDAIAWAKQGAFGMGWARAFEEFEVEK